MIHLRMECSEKVMMTSVFNLFLTNLKKQFIFWYLAHIVILSYNKYDYKQNSPCKLYDRIQAKE